MKQTRNLIGIAITCLLFAACQKDSRYTPANQLAKNNETSSASSRSHPKNQEEGPGWVYTLSNSSGINEVLAYHRAADGQLTFNAAYATGGTGTGGGLGNQGAVILADHGDVVLAVNAGSNTISSLKITGNSLNLKSTVPSGGLQPVSIAAWHDLVYVLNAGGNGSISGFRLMNNDKRVPIPNSSRPLSMAAATGPAQISFVQDGRVLVITEKATNTITTYTINEMGLPGVIHTMSSASPTPFGFATGNAGIIF